MHTIVVLGAGPCAAPIIRQTMRNIVLPSDKYKLYVVAPNTSYYYPLAIPRAVVPGQIPTDKISFPLEPHFSSYPPSKFEFVLGKADKLDPDTKAVEIMLNDGSSKHLSYDTLFIATGSSSAGDFPWKTIDSTEQTQKRISEVRNEIEKAKTIVVAGGGMSGAETAGELGYEYAQYKKKDVYFIYADPLPLYSYMADNVRQAAKNELDKLKVKSIPSTKVTNVTKNGNEYVLELRKSDGSTKTLSTQAYIPAVGLKPNTSFVPPAMLDTSNRIKTNTKLQAEGFSNIFVVGDASNLQRATLAIGYKQVEHLVKVLPEYFASGTVAEYKPNDQVLAAVTLGRSRGTGQAGTWKLPSLVVWWFKGRHLGTDVAMNLPAGKRTSMAVLEK